MSEKVFWIRLSILLFLLFISLYLIQYTDIDLVLQNLLFDPAQEKWLIDRSEVYKKFFLYNLPKIFLGSIIAFLLFLIFYKKNQSKQVKAIFFGLSITPLIVGNIKKFTHIYCPNQLTIYGGPYPYVRIFDSYQGNLILLKRGACFPAGHAVAGFCFFILLFVDFKRPSKLFYLTSNKSLIFILVSLYGWIIGFYQIAKGAHFFGDTLISMIACLITSLIIAKTINKTEERNN